MARGKAQVAESARVMRAGPPFDSDAVSSGGRIRRAAAMTLILAGAVILAALAVAACASWHLGRMASDVRPNPHDIALEQTSSAGPGENGVAQLVDWAYWQQVNPDIVAWVQVPGTSIDLPVVRAPGSDPDFYLSHDVYGNWNYHGCPYVDADCPEALDCANIVICGHNLIDRTMFTELEGFHDRAFAQAHDEVVLYTPEGTRRWRVVGSDTIEGWQRIKQTTFADARDFSSYLAKRLQECDVVTCDSVPAVSQMLTLCTCSYFQNPQDERTLIYAV